MKGSAAGQEAQVRLARIADENLKSKSVITEAQLEDFADRLDEITKDEKHIDIAGRVQQSVNWTHGKKLLLENRTIFNDEVDALLDEYGLATGGTGVVYEECWYMVTHSVISPFWAKTDAAPKFFELKQMMVAYMGLVRSTLKEYAERHCEAGDEKNKALNEMDLSGLLDRHIDPSKRKKTGL